MWFCSRTWTATQFCLGVLSSNRSSHGSKTANIWNILVISRLCKLCLCLSVRAKAEHSIVRDKHSRDRSVVRGVFSLFFIFSHFLSLSLSFFRQGCDAGVSPYIARLCAPDSCGGQEALCTPRHLGVHIRKRTASLGNRTPSS